MPQMQQLSEARKELVRACQTINFGRIEAIPIRDGEPVLDGTLRIVHEIKFGADNAPRREAALSNFQLRDVVRELLDHLDRLGDGVIDELVIKHGLPFSMTVRSTR